MWSSSVCANRVHGGTLCSIRTAERGLQLILRAMILRTASHRYSRPAAQNAGAVSEACLIGITWFQRSQMFEEARQLSSSLCRWVPRRSSDFLVFCFRFIFLRYFPWYSSITFSMSFSTSKRRFAPRVVSIRPFLILIVDPCVGCSFFFPTAKIQGSGKVREEREKGCH